MSWTARILWLLILGVAVFGVTVAVRQQNDNQRSSTTAATSTVTTPTTPSATPSQSGEVTATITKIVIRPNTNENGRQLIYARTVNNNILIDATGLMNVPAGGGMGLTCVDMPRVEDLHPGQQIDFRLAVAVDTALPAGVKTVYDICDSSTAKHQPYFFGAR